MSQNSRRSFLKHASVAALAGAAACTKPGGETSGPAVHAKKSYRWRLVTTWPPNLPVFSEGVKLMAERIATMSGGRLRIEVYAGGELLPPLETFDAVQQGTAEMGHGAAYYWAGKTQAAQFFTAVPFGLNAQQMYAWLMTAGGLQLWEELYAPFGILPIPAGNSGVQMGGWFNREIGGMEDLKGLKMRMPGLGGKVLAAAGASPELLPGGEIYTALERGVIDATEWVGPYHDYIMGFHKVAKFYYYPGWHEPGSTLELIVNRAAFDTLDAELQAIVRHAADTMNAWMLAQFDTNNGIYLGKLRAESQVQIRAFPDDVMRSLKRIARDTVAELANADALTRKIFDSFQKYQTEAATWANLSERPFYNSIQIDVP